MENKQPNDISQDSTVLHKNLRKEKLNANGQRLASRVALNGAAMQVGLISYLPAYAAVGAFLTPAFCVVALLFRFASSRTRKQAFETEQLIENASKLQRAVGTPKQELQRLLSQNEEFLKDRKSLTAQQLLNTCFFGFQYWGAIPILIKQTEMFMAQPSTLTAFNVLAYGIATLVATEGIVDTLRIIPQKAKLRRKMKGNIRDINRIYRQLEQEKTQEQQRIGLPRLMNRASVRIVENRKVTKTAGEPEKNQNKDVPPR